VSRATARFRQWNTIPPGQIRFARGIQPVYTTPFSKKRVLTPFLLPFLLLTPFLLLFCSFSAPSISVAIFEREASRADGTTFIAKDFVLQ
jgi:hypothetical protein